LDCEGKGSDPGAIVSRRRFLIEERHWQFNDVTVLLNCHNGISIIEASGKSLYSKTWAWISGRNPALFQATGGTGLDRKG